eukprot:3347263-Amphidinium_carterae.1
MSAAERTASGGTEGCTEGSACTYCQSGYCAAIGDVSTFSLTTPPCTTKACQGACACCSPQGLSRYRTQHASP